MQTSNKRFHRHAWFDIHLPFDFEHNMPLLRRISYMLGNEASISARGTIE
jgi:hypothetical protein